MPTYLNSTAARVTIGVLTIEPGLTAESDVYILASELPAGVTLQSDSPFYNDVVLSQRVDGGGSLSIPETVGSQSVRGVKVTIFCVSGQFTVTWNSVSNVPAINLEAGQQIGRVFRDRVIKSIEFNELDAGILSVLVVRL